MTRCITCNRGEVRQLKNTGRAVLLRVVKPQPFGGVASVDYHPPSYEWRGITAGEVLLQSWACPFGIPGDTLIVREAWAWLWPGPCEPANVNDSTMVYKADTDDKYPCNWQDDCGDDPDCPRWQPGSRMPAKRARFRPTIDSVQVVQVDGKWMWRMEVSQ